MLSIQCQEAIHILLYRHVFEVSKEFQYSREEFISWNTYFPQEIVIPEGPVMSNRL